MATEVTLVIRFERTPDIKELVQLIEEKYMEATVVAEDWEEV